MRGFDRLPKQPFILDGTAAVSSIGVALVSGIIVPGEGWLWLAVIVAGMLIALVSTTTARLYQKVQRFVEEARHDAQRRPVHLLIHEQMTEALKGMEVNWSVVVWSLNDQVLVVDGPGARVADDVELRLSSLDTRSHAVFTPYPVASQGGVFVYDPTSDEPEWSLWILLCNVALQDDWRLAITDRVNAAVDGRVLRQARDLAYYFQGYFSKANL